MAPAIRSLAIRSMAPAASFASNPSGSPIVRAMMFWTSAISTAFAVAKRPWEFKRPSTKLASVMVGLIPPRP